MKIKKKILKNMLIAAGLSLAIGCNEAPVVEPSHANPPVNPGVNSSEQTQATSKGNKPVLIVPKNPRKISPDYCPPCGKG